VIQAQSRTGSAPLEQQTELLVDYPDERLVLSVSLCLQFALSANSWFNARARRSDGQEEFRCFPTQPQPTHASHGDQHMRKVTPNAALPSLQASRPQTIRTSE